MRLLAAGLVIVLLGGCAAKPEPKPAAPPATSRVDAPAVQESELAGFTWVGEARPAPGKDARGLAQAKLATTFLTLDAGKYDIVWVDDAGASQPVVQGTWTLAGNELALTPGKGGRALSVLNYALEKPLRLQVVGGALRVA